MKWLPWIALGAGVLVLGFKATKAAIGYVRGQPTEVELTAIDATHWLAADAAAAFEKMRAAAAREGVTLTVNSAWRSMEEQQELWRQLQAGERTATVAAPGWSNHQSGTAVDLESAEGTNAAFAWLTANADTFGFRRTVPSEPWHWDFV